MWCAAARMRASSGSIAKSLAISSRVVMHAIVTERSTTGAMISLIARSIACGTRRRSAGVLTKSSSVGATTSELTSEAALSAPPDDEAPPAAAAASSPKWSESPAPPLAMMPAPPERSSRKFWLASSRTLRPASSCVGLTSRILMPRLLKSTSTSNLSVSLRSGSE